MATSQQQRFADKVVLVTGAGTGIGAAIATRFASEGGHVFGADVAWEAPDAPGTGVERIRCDVSDEADVARCVSGIEERFPTGVQILVNDAARSAEVPVRPFEDISTDDWTAVLTTNTLAPFLCTKAVAPRMREQGWGRVVNLTSGTIFQGVPGVLGYVSSKGAIAVMTQSLARELGADGITVNGLAPGLTMTTGMKANADWTPAIQERSIAARCLKREETADDLVGPCLFLASDDAGFVTGQILLVDGGQSFH